MMEWKLEDVDTLSLLGAMTMVSDWCDRNLACYKCPFKTDKGCVLDSPPHEWREEYKRNAKSDS